MPCASLDLALEGADYLNSTTVIVTVSLHSLDTKILPMWCTLFWLCSKHFSTTSYLIMSISKIKVVY